MAFAVGWTPCIGPVLGAILTLAAAQGNALRASLLLFVYSLGLGVPFLLIGLGDTPLDPPMLPPLVALAALVVAASSFLPDYRIVAALPIAYVAIGAGALLKHPRLRLTNDISYGTYIYAFPMQQLLATAGLYRLGVPVFAVASILVTLPMAVASWFGIERPALKLKRSRATAPSPAPVATEDFGPGAMPADRPTAEVRAGQ